MEDDTFVAEALVALADRAPIEPTGLAATIERRFVRRRYGGWTAAGVAVLVAVGLAIVVPVLGSRGGASAWNLADPGTTPPPPIEQVWPGTVMHVPTEPLDGLSPGVLQVIDSTHWLVVGGTGSGAYPLPNTVTLAVYDTVQQSYRKLTQISYNELYDFYMSFTVSGQWVVWAEESDSGTLTWIYRVPLAGGDRATVATLNEFPGALYATDAAIYWSESGPDYGIMRMSLFGGPAVALDADAGMILPYPRSPWAALVSTNGPRADRLIPGTDLYVTREMRNILTGQTIEVHAPPGTSSLQCTPQLCVGNAVKSSEAGAFIQQPDGSDRAPLLLGDGDPVLTYLDDGRTLLIAVHPDSVNTVTAVVADPSTGREASVPAISGMQIGLNFSGGLLTHYPPTGGTPSGVFYYLGGVR